MKIICFYLPQFHETEDNNKWWGKGFTDWIATKNAKPLFHFEDASLNDDWRLDYSKTILKSYLL